MKTHTKQEYLDSQSKNSLPEHEEHTLTPDLPRSIVISLCGFDGCVKRAEPPSIKRDVKGKGALLVLGA